jgi:16S rRNA (uracil1498-N3)-methyltransferase
MARECRRLFIPPPRLQQVSVEGVLPLSAEHSRYLCKVLRYGPGDRFAVVDGGGHLWEAELLDRERARLLQPPAEPLLSRPKDQPALVLAAAVVKRDFELVVRMAVELGVDRLVPLLCERTAVQGQLRPERWQSIAEEAAEQCERLWLPQIDPPTPLPELFSAGSSPCSAAVLRFWATTRQETLPLLVHALPSATDPPCDEVWLACGPEGGWSPAEEEQALACRWNPVQLGPTILRSSTAGVAAAALISHWRAARG